MESYVKRVYAVDKFVDSELNDSKNQLLDIWKEGQILVNESIEII